MRDAYIQLLVAQERRRELLKLRAQVFGSFAAISPEVAKQAIDTATKALDELQGLLFPGTEPEAPEVRQKREEAMLGDIFAQMGYGHLVPKAPVPVPVERPSLWEQLGE